MATTYQTIRDYLRDKLLTVTDIAEVSRYPKYDFQAWPAAVLIPAEGESEWETNAEHNRVYAFDLYICYATKQLGNDTTLDRLYDVVDDVLDALADDTNFETISLPANKTMLTVRPVSAGWESMNDDEILRAKIEVRVEISVLNN